MLDPVLIYEPHSNSKDNVKEDQIPGELKIVLALAESLLMGKSAPACPIEDIYPHKAENKMVEGHEHEPYRPSKQPDQKAEYTVNDVKRNRRQCQQHCRLFIVSGKIPE